MANKQAKSLPFFQHAKMLFAAGQAAEALKAYQRALALDPNHAAMHEGRGVVLASLGRAEDALKCFNRAQKLAPGNATILIHRGNLLTALDRPADAALDFESALALQPGMATALSGLGAAFAKQGDWPKAIASAEEAIARDPQLAIAYATKGAVLLQFGYPAEALACLEHATLLDGKNADTLLVMGETLMALRQMDKAAHRLCDAIDLAPQRLDLYLRAGFACYHARFRKTALEIYSRALAIDRENREALVGCSAILLELGRQAEALPYFELLHAAEPDAAAILIDREDALLSLNDWSALSFEPTHMRMVLERGGPPPKPFVLLAISDDPALHALAAAAYAQHVTARVPLPVTMPQPTPHDRIRIGYFSADFKTHATMCLMAELLEQHDRSRFEIFAFSFSYDDQSEWRERAIAGVEHFIDIQDKSDEETADLARKLGIDIAVDLKGYTADARTSLFARRVAPIQINYLGYPGSMAVPFMDYIVADPILIPLAEREHYSEQVITLPDSYQPNGRVTERQAAAMDRAQAGLPEDAFVYCCFNQPYKIQPAIYACWMAILRAVPDAVLWLWIESPVGRENLRASAQAAGVDPARLIFAETMPIADHLTRLPLADLFLDTAPYNAHTTASDALRMGLPLLTCAGHSFASRVASSLLSAAFLPELITHSLDAYREMAISLGQDRDRAADLKARLIANLATCPLFDSPRYTRHLERAYMMAHERQMLGLAPEDFVVPPIL